MFAAIKLLKSEPDIDLGIGTVSVLIAATAAADDEIENDDNEDDDEADDNAAADDDDDNDVDDAFKEPANIAGFAFRPAAFLRANETPFFVDAARLVTVSVRERILVVCPETKFDNANVASRATVSESALGREFTMPII